MAVCTSGTPGFDCVFYAYCRARLWLIALFVVGVPLCAPAVAQISPGPLSLPHQHLEGVGNCVSCHAFGSGTHGFKCLECHREIKRRLDARTGMHSHDYREAAGETDCARCHMEHNGEGFVLVRLDRSTFNHASETGFALQGKHRAQKCEACHTQKHIAAAARAEIKVKNLNHTFLGLGRECLSCHQDQHRGQLGADCTSCHNQDAWKPAPLFNHSRARFQLTGQHQTVACQKCHVPPAGDKTMPLRGLAFGACQDCHKDPHRGAFQETRARAACDSCHNTGGWKNNRPGGTFDHSTTKFTLVAKHAALLCSACHKTADFHHPIAHDQCKDCHKDPHSGQFAARAAGSDCGSCHTENGYKPTRFDRAAHALSAFPLEGKHADVACDKCHEPKGKDTVYKTGKLVCSACHEDKHRGQFASEPYNNRCERCHTSAGWKPDTFSVERHGQTQFALTGKHATVACRDCHKPLGETRQFHFDSRVCTTCHTDPHTTKLSCETCHTTAQWKPAGAFDHSSTGWRLDDEHGKVAVCTKCHQPAPNAAVTVAKAPVFAGTPRRCAECHAEKDVHGGQFLTGAAVEDCSLCHVPKQWKQTTFTHEKARFPLDIAHRNVKCEKCHKQQIQVQAKTVRVYRGTPAGCVECH